MIRFAVFWLCIGVSLALPAESLEDLLALRPPFPARNLQQQLDETLHDRAERIGAWEASYVVWLEQIADHLGLQMRIELSTEDLGTYRLMRLVDVDEEGNPVYERTQNIHAAISSQAKNMRRGLLGLDGGNEIAAVWDIGNILPTHQEFSGPEGSSRVTVRDSQPSSGHATHVGGTIGAGGVDPNAIGMSPRVHLESWDSELDLSEATANMAGSYTEFSQPAVSNHSYGTVTGWDHRTSDGSPDEKAWHWESYPIFNQHEGFGRYQKNAQRWDSLIYRNQSYLHVRAAGNDRNDGPRNGDTVYYWNTIFGGWDSETYDEDKQPKADRDYKGGYDTIAGIAIGKNILAVGAVTDAVSEGLRDPTVAKPTGFSSFGPADDGRIKPDIVANGADLYSPVQTSEDEYGIKSGTSMAAPSVTGTAVLLQQLARKVLTPSRRLYADELKGLLIHTADDLMNPGPDYQVGWGLINGASAAHLLQVAPFDKDNSALHSDYLSLKDDAEPSEMTFELEVDGTVDLKATLCWSDPAGGTRGADDRRPVLRHDLDLRILGPDNQVFYPFVLDPDHPSAEATTGDNVVDNVEQVLVENVESGTYTIRVSAKNVDTGVEKQGFSVWVSPVLDPLAVSVDVYEATASADSFEQKIYAEGAWSISTPVSWLTASLSKGFGPDVVQMQFEPNVTNQSRSATVFVTADNSRGQITFQVTQEGLAEVTLAEALDQADLTFTTTGTPSWFGQELFHNGDGDGAVITGLADGAVSSFNAQFAGPGEVIFDYDVDSEVNDYFRFYVNGSLFILESGVDQPWRTYRLPLNPGLNTLTWEYKKDSGGSAGEDYAAVDHLRISRLVLSEASVSVPASGEEKSLTVSIENPVFPNGNWSVRNFPDWLKFDQTEFMGPDTLVWEVRGNMQTTPRQGTFEVGNDNLGWQLVTVTQSGQEAHLDPNNTFQDFPFTFTQDEEDVPWFGLESFGEANEPALVASGLQSGQHAILETTLQGPGFLYFGIYEGYSAGREDDYFGFSINGTYTRVIGSGKRDSIDTSIHRFVIPEGEHVVTFEFYYEGGVSYDRTAAIRGLSFVPGEVSLPEDLIPAQGLTGTLEVEVPEGRNWELSIPDARQRIRINQDRVSGTGPFTVPVEFLANTFPTQSLNYISFRLPEQGHRSDYRILFQVEPFETSTIANALDQPDLVFTVSSDDPNDPTNALIQGQNALSKDGRDALVIGPQNPTGGMVQTSIAGPAVVSFDYFIPEGLRDVFIFRVPEISLTRYPHTGSNHWETLSFEIPEGVTATPEWKDRDYGYVYIDRLRIVRPHETRQGVTVGRQGGSISVPLPEEGAPIFSEAWAQTTHEDGLLKITFDPLPEQLNSRIGTVSVGTSRIPFMQLDHRSVEEAYLAEVGAADPDELFNDPQKHPLGDLDNDGDRNLVEWVFGRPLGLSDSPATPNASGITLTLRDSPWVRPVLMETTELPGFISQPLLRENGIWTQTGLTPLLEIKAQHLMTQDMDQISFEFKAPLPDRYFYYPSASGR